MDNLIDDCLYHIFTFLDVEDIKKCSLVNKHFNIVTKNELIWKMLFEKDNDNTLCHKNFYKNYKKYDILNKNFKYFTNLLTEKDVGDVTEITIMDEELLVLPPIIGRLFTLRILYCCFNKFEMIPKEIGMLYNLKTLNFRRNKLKAIPSELGQLSKLEGLSLSFNYLTELPLEIWNLTNLKTLDLSDNSLTEISPKIKQLTKLQIIYLENNERLKIPVELGQINTLIKIQISSYQSHMIPQNIFHKIILV